MQADSPTLEVAPLPEPIEPPWGADDGAGAEEGGSAPGTGELPELSRADTVEMLVGVVQVPFALAALARGQHWNLTEAEALSVAAPLSRALPPAWLTSRILAASPWLVVATATYQLVGARLALDAAIAANAARMEVPADDTRAGSPAPSRAAPGDNGAVAGDPGPATGWVANPGEFAGAGLGLGGAPDGGPPGGSAGRRRGNDGRFAASPAN